eukprot:gene27072-59228_t
MAYDTGCVNKGCGVGGGVSGRLARDWMRQVFLKNSNVSGALRNDAAKPYAAPVARIDCWHG